MRKFRSELYESMYDGFLYDFNVGRITEAEFREFEADAFVEEDTANETGIKVQEETPRQCNTLATVTEHETA